MIIFKATEGSEMEYKKGMKKTGGYPTMETSDVLYPTGVQTNSKEEEEKKLRVLQEGAEAKGILLPTQFNRSSTSTQMAENEEILMPCGY